MKNLANIKNLEIENVNMWKMKTKTIPVIVGARYDQKGNTEIPGNLFLAEIQKIVLLIFLEDLVKSYLSKQNNYNILYNY